MAYLDRSASRITAFVVAIIAYGYCGSASGESTDATFARPTLARPKLNWPAETDELQARYDALWNVYHASVQETTDRINVELEKLSDAAQREGNLDSALRWKAAIKQFSDTGSLERVRDNANTFPESLKQAFVQYGKAVEHLAQGHLSVSESLTQTSECRTLAVNLGIVSESFASAPSRQRLFDLVKEKACDSPLYGAPCEHLVFSGRPEKGDWRRHAQRELGKPSKFAKALLNETGEEVGCYFIGNDSRIIIDCVSGEAVISNVRVRERLGETEVTGYMTSVGSIPVAKGNCAIRKPITVTRATVAFAKENYVGEEVSLRAKECPNSDFGDDVLAAEYARLWTDYQGASARAEEMFHKAISRLADEADEIGNVAVCRLWDKKQEHYSRARGFSWRTSKNVWRQWFGEREYPGDLLNVVAEVNRTQATALASLRNGYKANEISLTKAGQLDTALAVRREAESIAKPLFIEAGEGQLLASVSDPISGLPMFSKSYRLTSAGCVNESIANLAPQGQRWRAVKSKEGREIGCYTRDKEVIIMAVPDTGVMCFAAIGYDNAVVVLDGQLMRPDKKVALARGSFQKRPLVNK